MNKATKAQIRATPSLKKRPEFLRVQNGGRKWVSPGVIVMAAARPQGAEDDNQRESLRFGLTVTKKLSKSAVVRNRMRRRLRAAALDVLPAKAARNHDYVLIARPETGDYPYDKLCSDLKWCLKRLSCLIDTP